MYVVQLNIIICICLQHDEVAVYASDLCMMHILYVY